MAKHGLSHEGPQTTPALLSFLVGISQWLQAQLGANRRIHCSLSVIEDLFFLFGLTMRFSAQA